MMGLRVFQNPFIDNAIVSKGDYCPCEGIEEALLTRIKNGQNVALVGKRRVGKSSIAHHITNNLVARHKSSNTALW